MNISVLKVKELREETGVSITKCKEALVEAKGDKEKAKEILRKKGIAKAESRSERKTSEGFVGSYIHSTGRVGAIVSLACETDFVSRNEEFQALAKDIAMQITAMNPKYISPEDTNEEDIEKEKEIFMEQLKNEGKPENIIEKILEGKINKFKEEGALLKQKSIKDSSVTIEEMIKESIAKMGENIKVVDFKRIEI